jgi:hypothetical protein
MRGRQIISVELLEQGADLGPVALGGLGDLGIQVGAARRAVTVADYQAEQANWQDPNNREKQLLRQLTALVTELIPTILDRKELHNNLAQHWDQWQHLPEDERPTVSRTFVTDSTGLITELIADLTPEIAAALKAGTAAARSQLDERLRLASLGR